MDSKTKTIYRVMTTEDERIILAVEDGSELTVIMRKDLKDGEPKIPATMWKNEFKFTACFLFTLIFQVRLRYYRCLFIRQNGPDGFLLGTALRFPLDFHIDCGFEWSNRLNLKDFQ